MNQFRDISKPELLDMLAKQTPLYTQMLADNIKTKEFYKCKRLIEQLVSEIELRKMAVSGESTISDPVTFREE